MDVFVDVLLEVLLDVFVDVLLEVLLDVFVDVILEVLLDVFVLDMIIYEHASHACVSFRVNYSFDVLQLFLLNFFISSVHDHLYVTTPVFPPFHLLYSFVCVHDHVQDELHVVQRSLSVYYFAFEVSQD